SGSPTCAATRARISIGVGPSASFSIGFAAMARSAIANAGWQELRGSFPPPKAQNAVINSNRGSQQPTERVDPLIIYWQDQPPFALVLRSVDLPGADPILDKH